MVQWTLLTAVTAFVSWWSRTALDARPGGREPGSPAACDPAAARAQQRLADTLPWRWAETWLARRAVRPFRVRPPLHALRVLNLDHGPGGVACALALTTPQDSTIVAAEPLAGMAELARHRAARRGVGRRLCFMRAWSWGLPFRDGAFDVVVSVGALHGWPNPRTIPALAEVRRVLAPQGRFLVADLRRDVPWPLWLVMRAAQALSPRDLRALDEPSASVRAAYAPHEAEWLAGHARLPDLKVTAYPGWLMIERVGDEARQA